MALEAFKQIARAALLLAAAGDAGAAAAEPAAAGRAVRELTTDRPDATESPFTVEPGFVQVEMDFANYGRDREAGVRATEWEAMPFNVRVGLTPRSELGVFVVPWRTETETAPGGPRVRSRGFGDATLRAKYNFAGNDGGAGLAFGLIADLKVPTGASAVSNGKTEGALTLPVAFELGGGWGGGAMTSVERVYSDVGRHRTVWSNTFTVSRDLTETTGGFLELTSSAGDGRHVATFNCGLTYAVHRDAQLDCGVNLGLSRSAPDVQVFAGVSRRF